MSILPLVVIALNSGSLEKPVRQAAPEATRAVRCVFSTLNYIKEDGDEGGEGDEPYVIVFRCGFRFLRSSNPAQAGVISKPILTGLGPIGQQDDPFLGHKENQWAQAGRQYPISTLSMQTQVPYKEANVIGLTALMIDRDGFDGKQRAEISRAVRSQIEAVVKSIRERPRPFNPTQPFYSGDLLSALNRLSLTDSQLRRIRAMGKGDPDEIGGFQSVVLISNFSDPAAPKPNDVMALIPRANTFGSVGIARVNVTTRGEGFTLNFPAVGIGAMSGEFRYTGKCQLLGSVMLPTIQ